MGLFVVHTNISKSNKRMLNDGLPRGSVLAPYFSTFTHVIYQAQLLNNCIMSQETEFYKFEQILNSKLHTLD